MKNEYIGFALPTDYDGIKYRSRREARWAMFFKSMDIRFDYEPEAFQLEDGLFYLPDFWFPDLGIFGEIKGGSITRDEEYKAHRLAAVSGRPVYIMAGQIQARQHGDSDDGNFTILMPDGGQDHPYLWCQCPACGFCDVQFDGLWARNKKCKCGSAQRPSVESKAQYHDTPVLRAAYEKAREYTFWTPRQ